MNHDTKRNIWARAFFMLLMSLALHVSVTLILVVTVIQFVMSLINDAPNTRLLSFGRSLGRYLQQIVYFLTFASEEISFPFNDWPSTET
ncbi:MAG: DUF4389 domain-containing protein [Burkholderiales bacterium]|nr:DUF4389 domain-containing protein [Burkholderiales bacterium]